MTINNRMDGPLDGQALTWKVSVCLVDNFMWLDLVFQVRKNLHTFTHEKNTEYYLHVRSVAIYYNIKNNF